MRITFTFGDALQLLPAFGRDSLNYATLWTPDICSGSRACRQLSQHRMLTRATAARNVLASLS